MKGGSTGMGMVASGNSNGSGTTTGVTSVRIRVEEAKVVASNSKERMRSLDILNLDEDWKKEKMLRIDCLMMEEWMKRGIYR